MENREMKEFIENIRQQLCKKFGLSKEDVHIIYSERTSEMKEAAKKLGAVFNSYKEDLLIQRYPEDIVQSYDKWRFDRIDDLQRGFVWCTQNDYFIPDEWLEEYLVHMQWLRARTKDGKKG